MFKHYFEQIQNVSIWPIISLSIFFLFFLLLLLWLLKVDKKYIQKMKNMPLDEDDKIEGDVKEKANNSNILKKMGAAALIWLFPLLAQAQETTQTASGIGNDTLLLVIISLVIIMAILVLWVAVYTLRVLQFVINQEKERKAVEAGSIPEPQPSWWHQIWQKLNKSVPVAQEQTVMLDHDYDGIKELDNHLPPWWTALFYFTIVVGVIYMFVYHVFDAAPLQAEEYEIEMAEAQAAMEARLAAAPPEESGIDENTVEITDDPGQLANGKKVYEMQCASCHRNDGGGNIGPNLTDEYWIHGGGVKDIFYTVKYGVPEKGMISWEPLLSPVQMRDVSSYILTLVGTNPANAKAAQGELYTPEESDPAPVPDSVSQEVPVIEAGA